MCLRDPAADNRRVLGTCTPWGKSLGNRDGDNNHSDISKRLIYKINNCLFTVTPVTLFKCRWQMSVRSDKPILSLPEGSFKPFFFIKKTTTNKHKICLFRPSSFEIRSGFKIAQVSERMMYAMFQFRSDSSQMHLYNTSTPSLQPLKCFYFIFL